MLQLIEKLNMELLAVREKAALSPITAGEMLELSCQIAKVQLCIDSMDMERRDMEVSA